MRHRFLAPRCALGVVIATLSLAPVPVAGQTPSAAAKKAKTWTAPRTQDGQPDLQGIWSFATLTSLERPSELAGKQVLTNEEAAQLDEQAALNRDRPPREGSTGAYNSFWVDRGKATNRTSLIVDPPEGRIPPLTPEGQKRAAAHAAALLINAGPEDRDMGERCILGFNSGPPITPGGYNQNVQLLQIPGYVVILNEMVHNARVVPLDGRPHGNIRQWNGDSRGRWEGDTLVVDTTNFTDKPRNAAFAWSRGTEGKSMHLVERFRRVDAETLLYEFTIEDPTMWTRPWTASIPMTKSQEPIYEYACHEGNYGMFGILAGARAEEKAAEAAK